MTAPDVPPPLEPLLPERDRIRRIVGRLGETADLAERADLAHELVRALARYRDVMTTTVAPALDPDGRWPSVHGSGPSEARLVEAMEVVRRRTSHVDPRNAHTGGAQELEDAIAEVVDGTTRRLDEEDRALAPAVAGLPEASRRRLGEAVRDAAAHPSEHPRPARTAVGRALQNVAIKLDTAFEDVATPTHPGAPVIDGADEGTDDDTARRDRPGEATGE